MRPRRFPEADAVYSLPGGNEDNDLWIWRIEHGDVMTEWELTDAEREAIANGARVYLRLWNEPIPPVAMGVVSRGDDGEPIYIK